MNKEIINEFEDESEAEFGAESEYQIRISKNIELLDARIRTCSTVADTHLNVNPDTGDFLSIGDGIVPEGSESVAITIGDRVPDISGVFFGSETKLSRVAIEVVRRTVAQWNESLERR